MGRKEDRSVVARLSGRLTSAAIEGSDGIWCRRWGVVLRGLRGAEEYGHSSPCSP